MEGLFGMLQKKQIKTLWGIEEGKVKWKKQGSKWWKQNRNELLEMAKLERVKYKLKVY